MNLAKFQDTKLIYRSLFHFYTQTTKYQKEKLGKQFHLPSHQKKKKNPKCLRINIPKKVKGLYSENYKALMKEIKDDTNRKKDILCSWIRRIYCDHTTQGNIQIQCNPCQNTNDILHRTGTNHSETSVETQETPNSQNSLEEEKKLEKSCSLTSDYTINLQ